MAYITTEGDYFGSFVNGYYNPKINYATCSSAPPSSSSSSSCFAGSETVQLASGAVKMIENVQLGDEILVASMDGKSTTYSPVIAIPHPKNTETAHFLKIVTNQGRDIKLTADHLILGGVCNSPFSLLTAGALVKGDCVKTQDGESVVEYIEEMSGNGIYTVVTKDDGLLVVNGFVASPFSTNHLVANSFYNILRWVDSFAPFLARTSVTSFTIKAFGDVLSIAF